MHISNEGIIVILFVGLVAGWLAGKIVRGTGFGIIGDILVGIAGALVASFLFPKLGIHLGTGLVSEIIYSAIGAIMLLLIVRLVRRRTFVTTRASISPGRRPRRSIAAPRQCAGPAPVRCGTPDRSSRHAPASNANGATSFLPKPGRALIRGAIAA